ncbi:hypothetical protein FIBSPDRAFT_882434 [Athelia psychrophila]|uniref:Uncharacterized protein n=1 Tax=Athelia psychrophila TaxID=1759441 RepID=A0A166VCT4_9AGAM|nr:hypothetical protein FIBSPDRAFT_882434 [Fibularhizoctonia sp. CBS 109695]
MESNVSVYGVVSVSAGPGPGVVRTGVRTATRDVLVFVSDTYGQASECGRPLLQFLTKSASCGRLEVVPARPNPKYVGQERYGPPKTEDDELKINRDKSRVGTDQCPELRRGRGEAGGKHAQAVPAVKETESTATTTRGRVRRLTSVGKADALLDGGELECRLVVSRVANVGAGYRDRLKGAGAGSLDFKTLSKARLSAEPTFETALHLTRRATCHRSHGGDGVLSTSRLLSTANHQGRAKASEDTTTQANTPAPHKPFTEAQKVLWVKSSIYVSSVTQLYVRQNNTKYRLEGKQFDCLTLENLTSVVKVGVCKNIPSTSHWPQRKRRMRLSGRTPTATPPCEIEER